MADLARLLESSGKQEAIEMLDWALANSNPRLRAVAARIVHVMNLRDLRETMRRRMDEEIDPSATRELARAVEALSKAGTEEWGAATVREPDSPTRSDDVPSEDSASAWAQNSDAPRAFTLADLPAGFSEAVFSAWECGMPEANVLGVAHVSCTGKRPAQIELLQMPFSRACREAVTVLLRAGLAPEGLALESRERRTVYIVLGPGLEGRFGELEPDKDSSPGPPRNQTVFGNLGFPPGKWGYCGKVVLRLIVAPNGVPGNIQVLKSGGGDFDGFAVLTASRWRYEQASTWFQAVVNIGWQCTDHCPLRSVRDGRHLDPS